MFKELGVRCSKDEFDAALKDLAGEDGVLSFAEFETALRAAVVAAAAAAEAGAAAGAIGTISKRRSGIRSESRAAGAAAAPPRPLTGTFVIDGAVAVMSPREDAAPGAAAVMPLNAGGGGGGDDDDDGGGGDGDDDESDGDDDEASKLTPAQIKVRAYSQLAGAIILVTLFSDPMCDVLGELGARLQAATGLANAAFYIAFVVTPVISNATEIISSVIFASRKTQASAVITYAQLLGAAAMNNSFCLAIFLAIVYIKQLEWNFSAEVLVILLVEAVMCAVAFVQKTPIWRAIIPFALYPLALVTVYALERAGMS